MVVTAGATAIFNCRSSGDPTPNIEWMLNSDNIPMHDPRYHLMDDGSLKIDKVDASVIGQYECIAKNALGEKKSRSARVAIQYDEHEQSNIEVRTQQKPIITLAPFDAVVTPRDSIVLHCMASGK